MAILVQGRGNDFAGFGPAGRVREHLSLLVDYGNPGSRCLAQLVQMGTQIGAGDIDTENGRSGPGIEADAAARERNPVSCVVKNT
ncbi:MAG: hypothetical protein R6W86_15735 [Marinobacter sp.]|uniref:hypothetical protein n=1 Tax=Marinobacter sp. TaxID=50741 RepID=UPI00396F0F18